jgi:hypothetical protein
LETFPFSLLNSLKVSSFCGWGNIQPFNARVEVEVAGLHSGFVSSARYARLLHSLATNTKGNINVGTRDFHPILSVAHGGAAIHLFSLWRPTPASR